MKLRIIVLAFILFLCGSGCLNPLGNKKTETTAAKTAESVSNQQSLSFERTVKSSPISSVEISVPVNSNKKFNSQTKSVEANVKTNILSSSNLKTNNVNISSEIVENFDNQNIRITIPAKTEEMVKSTSQGDVSSTGTVSSSYMLVKDISLGGKLILIGIGLLILFLVIELFRRRYQFINLLAKKLDQAAVAGESKLAERINGLREVALRTHEPVENARIASELASLTDARGKLKAEIAKLKNGD